MSKPTATSSTTSTISASEEVKLPPGITWHTALKTGWYEKPGLSFYLREVLLGIIICMAQIPESIAFAYLARVRPPVALHAAWVVGLVCAVLGGRPGMINGATGAFAAIVSSFLAVPEAAGGNGEGVELLFPSVMVGGVLMLVVWAIKLDRFITMLPLPVMVGFCNGLAIVSEWLTRTPRTTILLPTVLRASSALLAPRSSPHTRSPRIARNLRQLALRNCIRSRPPSAMTNTMRRTRRTHAVPPRRRPPLTAGAWRPARARPPAGSRAPSCGG
jgi:hypothetical protein